MSPDVAGTVLAPEHTETADYFAKALELCGAGNSVTVQSAIRIMLRIGWNTIAKEGEGRLLCGLIADAEGQAPLGARAADRHEPQPRRPLSLPASCSTFAAPGVSWVRERGVGPTSGKGASVDRNGAAPILVSVWWVQRCRSLQRLQRASGRPGTNYWMLSSRIRSPSPRCSHDPLSVPWTAACDRTRTARPSSPSARQRRLSQARARAAPQSAHEPLRTTTCSFATSPARRQLDLSAGCLPGPYTSAAAAGVRTERVKQEAPVLVIVGNPPYDGSAGMAVDEERELSEAYRTTKRIRKPEGQGLNDPYVRFFRMAERLEYGWWSLTPMRD